VEATRCLFDVTDTGQSLSPPAGRDRRRSRSNDVTPVVQRRRPSVTAAGTGAAPQAARSALRRRHSRSRRRGRSLLSGHRCLTRSAAADPPSSRLRWTTVPRRRDAGNDNDLGEM